MSHPTSPAAARREQRAGLAGVIGAVLFVLAGAAGFVLETTARTEGMDDGDNPAEGLALFAVNPSAYSLSGLALSTSAIALLLLLVLTVAETALRSARPLYARFVTGLGLISVVLFFLAGVIRLQAPGTVTHIASLDRDWGLAAYLAVQMSGTQGALSAAIFACALWSTGLCVASARPRSLPVAVLVLGVLPALVVLLPLGALVGRLAGQSIADLVYPVYLVAIVVGLPLFMLALGAALWRMRRRLVD
ncbi:hypothetical protein K2F54_09295 [Cryobacterium sp. 1639]|uniref:hypothetical protein n=1 Tax=Cryobacterium inferilacus TaxID=2866629 RepID=UPI001C73C284|nr:hypothetical protein [Cryobacterium sp. 1639]MBX0300169.1 hypothetical protein [Cryobacterium sp. 1639]